MSLDPTLLHKPNSPFWKKGKPIRPVPLQREDDNAKENQLDDELAGLFGELTVAKPAEAKTPIYNIKNPISTTATTRPKSNIVKAVPMVPVTPKEPLVISGLKVTLLPHQEDGIRWLQEKERLGKSGCILADDMGLGKTVQIIGLMLASRSSREDVKFKTTLIVAPVSLLDQWKNEIKSKTNAGLLSVLIHHGPGRTNSVNELLRYDVVLTTYGVVTSSFKEDVPAKSGQILLNDDGYDENGAIMKANFHRIVLDEAHSIKNYKSKGAKACTQLKALHRICMTGTPIHNSIDELYSLVRFLQLPAYERLSDFKRISANPANLQTLLSGIMLRRTKKGLAEASESVEPVPVEGNGSSSASSSVKATPDIFTINLPPKTITDVQVYLDSHELEFYKRVEESGQLKIKNAQKADSLNRMVVLSLLLRLRQICNHRRLPGLSSKEELSEFNDGVDLTQNPAEIDSLDELVSKMSLGGDSSERKEVKPLPWERQRTLPSFKKAVPEITPVIDLTTSSDEDIGRRSPRDSLIPLPTCLMCGLTLFDSEPESLCEDCVTNKSIESIVSDDVEEDEESLEISVSKSSSKVNKIIALIQARLKRAPGEKFIVFSQWTSTFKILDPALRAQGIKFIQYDGKMSSKTKAEALSKFRENSSITVCLMSLMCGAVGLNLTCANNVILTDLWWNPMLEDQAIDRVYRIGQKKPVFIHRMIVVNSVEERIVALQNKKRELVEQTIGGKEGFKPKTLSIGELVALFGI
ncbi:hypothetical protein HDU79_005627 [Rhizoclosmatium sp. JEL0117]|nr:hypothetical protein HDU79_005627 [Rhizoclosmatium sp. JEL0117]